MQSYSTLLHKRTILGSFQPHQHEIFALFWVIFALSWAIFALFWVIFAVFWVIFALFFMFFLWILSCLLCGCPVIFLRLFSVFFRILCVYWVIFGNLRLFLHVFLLFFVAFWASFHAIFVKFMFIWTFLCYHKLSKAAPNLTSVCIEFNSSTSSDAS